MKIRKLLWIFPVLLVGWFALAEAIEPRRIIQLSSLLWQGPPPVRLELGNGLVVHAYSDTRPHVGKIMTLQKGLVLVKDGEELIEEGYGFGAPIVIYQGRQYVSQHAGLSLSEENGQITKRFQMDVVDTWTEFLRRKYRPVPSIGTVVFTYTVDAPGELSVAVDFSGLKVQPELAYLTNEQGARHFTLYSDSTGIERRLADYEDQWLPVSAASTCFASETRNIRFCVETDQGQAKFAGRERYVQYRWTGIFWLSWAGIDIERNAPRGTYQYRILPEVLR